MELIDLLQESQRLIEKQKIELEVHNSNIDPCDENVIIKIVQKLDEWFGKPPLDSTYDSWNTFIKLLREKGEAIDKYIVKFETAISEMKSNSIELSQTVLAVHFLSTLNVSKVRNGLFLQM